MNTLTVAGCIGFSNGREPMTSTLVLRRAMEYAASHGFTLFMQAEDGWLAAGGCVHEGPVSIRMGLAGIPESAETVEVSRMLVLAEQTGVKIHFNQLSTAGAVKLVQQARQNGLQVSADVAIHHLHLTEMDITGFHANYHVRPPLRDQRSQQALREGLKSGAISAICSDHQPHDADAKLAPFAETEPGISGLETLLPLTLRLVEDGTLDLSGAIANLTSKPAEVLGLPLGRLGVGDSADICIFDPNQHWSLQADNMFSMGHNSPFIGWDLKGKVTYALLNGKISYQAQDI